MYYLFLAVGEVEGGALGSGQETLLLRLYQWSYIAALPNAFPEALGRCPPPFSTRQVHIGAAEHLSVGEDGCIVESLSGCLQVFLVLEEWRLDGLPGVLNEVGPRIEVGVPLLVLLDFGNGHLLEKGLNFRRVSVLFLGSSRFAVPRVLVSLQEHPFWFARAIKIWMGVL